MKAPSKKKAMPKGKGKPMMNKPDKMGSGKMPGGKKMGNGKAC